MRQKIVGMIGASLLWVAACSDSSELASGVPHDHGAEANARNDEHLAELRMGDQGAAVETLQRGLAGLGYLPNADLSVEYPGVKPVVDDEPTAGEYDETTRNAVSALQQARGLPVTGVADEETLRTIYAPQCGVPDSYRHEDSHNKFSLLSSAIGAYKGPFTLSSISWGVTGVPVRDASGNVVVSIAQAAAAARWVFGMYSSVINKTFVEMSSGTPDILIQLEERLQPPGERSPPLASTTAARWQNDQRRIKVNSLYPFSVATPTPTLAYDLYHVLAHEIGHALGLGHSATRARERTANGNVLVQNIMFPNAQPGPISRTVQPDDRAGLSALYNTFQQVPGFARDLGAGENGDVWKVSEIGTGVRLPHLQAEKEQLGGGQRQRRCHASGRCCKRGRVGRQQRGRHLLSSRRSL